MAVKNVTALLSQTLRAQVPASQLPITLKKTPIGNLYEILSRTPSAGVGLQVHQTRWGTKEIHGSYWVVSRAQFKREGKNGKAWGRLYWKGPWRNPLEENSCKYPALFSSGKLVSEKEERIRGCLKYNWMEGPSIAKSIRLKEIASEASAEATPSTASTVRHFIS